MPETGDGETALICASQAGHLNIVKALLKKSDVNLYATNEDGHTALEEAELNSQKRIVNHLHQVAKKGGPDLVEARYAAMKKENKGVSYFSV